MNSTDIDVNEFNNLFLDASFKCPLTRLTFSELLNRHNSKINNKKEFIVARVTLKEKNLKKFIFYNAKELCREIFENSISHSYKIKIRAMKDPISKENIEKIEFFAVRRHSQSNTYFTGVTVAPLENNEENTEESYRAIFIGTHLDFLKNQNLRDQICDALDYLPINFNDPTSFRKKQRIWYTIFSILLAIFFTGILFYILESRDVFHRTYPFNTSVYNNSIYKNNNSVFKDGGLKNLEISRNSEINFK